MKFYLGKYYVASEEINTSYYSDSFCDRALYEEIGKKGVVETQERVNSRDAVDIDGEKFNLVFLFIGVADATSSSTDAVDIGIEALNYLGVYTIKKPSAVESSILDVNEQRFGFMSSTLKDDFIRKANLYEYFTIARSPKFFYDRVMSSKEVETAIKNISDLPHSVALNEEVEKINFDFTRLDNSLPVHYMIEGLESCKIDDSVDSLCSILVNGNRVVTNHFTVLDFDKFDCLHTNWYARYEKPLDIITDNLANTLAGNIIVIKYGLYDDEDDYYVENYKAFTKFLEILKPYMFNTQLIFVVPSNKPFLQKRIMKHVGMPIVTITKDGKPSGSSFGYNEKLTYLKKLTTKDSIPPNDYMEIMLKEKMEDKGDWDIDDLYKEWKTQCIINSNYPQYSDELEQFKELKHQQKPDAMERLDELIGLKQVKAEIKEILAKFKMSQYTQSAGLPTCDYCLHMAFLGSPGTGKSEIASLFGEIFKESGVLSEGRVIYNSGYIASKTIDNLFRDNHGSVLFFDEAYDLAGTDSVTTLIANMERYRSDTIVILAGYENKMNILLDCNQGFRSRIGGVLRFPDYSAEELFEIYKLMCRKSQKVLDGEALDLAREYFFRGGKPSNQGNARYVRNFVEKCIGNQQVRLSKKIDKNSKYKFSIDELKTILPQDLDVDANPEKSAIEQFNELIDLENVKTTITKRINFAASQKLRRDSGVKTEFLPMHMSFMGNPGTGKTEVARLVGKMLAEKGVLSVGDIIECDPGSLLYPSTVEGVFEKAKGSVLFVDEAYTLADVHPVILSTFMKQMEDCRKDVVVIFAGYTYHIKALLKSNPGFESRITDKIMFEDYSIESLVDIAKLIAQKQNYFIDKNAISVITDLIQKGSLSDNFGNARFSRLLIEKAIINQGDRIMLEYQKTNKTPSKRKLKQLCKRDFNNISVDDLCKCQKPIGFASSVGCAGNNDNAFNKRLNEDLNGEIDSDIEKIDRDDK